ncbi:MAG: hypothetical protein K1060chlam3_00321 [Candidatus Anoxychlamydiales bacterium]|nr:hypothetical protein [Candidatus Anoxychlamydiales bacterium]
MTFAADSRKETRGFKAVLILLQTLTLPERSGELSLLWFGITPSEASSTLASVKVESFLSTTGGICSCPG